MIRLLRSSRLVKNSAIYLVSNVLNAAIPFLLLPVLTRYLAPAEYGQVAMFQIVVSALAAIVGLNAQTAANRKYYDQKGSTELGHFIGAGVQILVVSTLLTALLVFAARATLAGWLGMTPAWIMWAVAVAAASFLVNLRLGQWQVRGDAIDYGSLQVGSSLANVLLSLLLVVVLHFGARGRIDAIVIVTLSFAAVSLLSLAREGLLRISWRPDHILENLRFGVPLVPHVAGMFLLNAADRLVINTRFGLAEAGIYMVALQLTLALNLVFDAFNKAYIPWLFERLERKQARENRLIVRWTYRYFGLALLAAAAAFAIGPYAVRLLAGREYHGAGQFVGWLALGQAFFGMYLMVTNYLFYARRTGLLASATGVSGLVNIGLLMLLTSAFGVLGAAIAFALANVFRFGLTWFIAQRQHPMPWFQWRAT